MASQFDAVTSMGLTGPQVRPDGTPGSMRLDKTGAAVQTNAHGWYHEAAARGKLFHATIAAAGVAPGTALSASPAFTLWNPVNSGINLSIKQVFVGYVSGTLGAGSLVHAMNLSQVTLPSGGTELVPQCALLNGARGTGRAFTGSTISATSTLIRPSMTVGAALASSVAFPSLVMDEVAGSIVVPAGAAYCYQGIAAAGTSPLLLIGVTWEEITLPT